MSVLRAAYLRELLPGQVQVTEIVDGQKHLPQWANTMCVVNGVAGCP